MVSTGTSSHKKVKKPMHLNFKHIMTLFSNFKVYELVMIDDIWIHVN